MSHLKERKEKTCLNCNSPVEARYCSVCGQENLEPQEGVWHLVSHFFNDITHFDGKFFLTLKDLIFKPGFLSKEYVAGRRAKYLNPIRMYVFTSFIFFLIYFSFIDHPSEQENEKQTQKTGQVKKIPNAKRDSIAKAVNKELLKDSIKNKNLTIDKDGNVDIGGNFQYNNYRDEKEYDSLIAAGKVHDNFIQKWFRRREFKINKKYGSGKRVNDQLEENFKHSIPQLFFLSLPFLALFLKLLYVRRKQFYYVAHAIFVLHLFIFVYIGALITFGINALSDLPYFGWLGFVQAGLILWILYYGYRAMYKFYGQGKMKTTFKYILLLIGLIVILLISVVIMFFYSFMKL